MKPPRLAPIPAGLPATVPFVAPDELERRRGAVFAARLGANENGFGPSPLAIAAMQAALPRIWRYADPTAHDLMAALARHLGVPASCLMHGEGIDGLLGLLVRLMIAPGDPVVTSDGAYPTFNYHVAASGGVLHKVPYRDDAEDPQALASAAQQHAARLVYLANPDNPMGSWLRSEAIFALIEALPPDCLLVLDEAYGEFAPPEAIPALDPDEGRAIRLRTFSKAYGLAGARIGYAIGHPDLIAGFDRIRNHFGVNALALAGALAALEDRDWLERTRAEVARARASIAEIGAANGMRALPSATNFVALDTGRDGAGNARLVAALAGRGVFVRMPGVAPLNRCIRVSCAPAAELDVLARTLPGALAED